MQRFKVTFTKHFVGGNLDGLSYYENHVTFANLNDAHDYMNWLETHQFGSPNIIKGFGDQNYQVSRIVLEMM